MSTINKALLLGRLGRDPETRFVKSGKQITSFSLATSEKWTDSDGTKKENTTWHSVTCFGKLAEIAATYLKKGSRVYVEGRLVLEEWEKDGKKIHQTKIYANELKFMDAGNKTDAGKTDKATEGEKNDDVPF